MARKKKDKTTMLVDTFRSATLGSIPMYINHNGIDLTRELNESIKHRYSDNFARYYNAMVETVNRDVNRASFGLPTKNPTKLQEMTAEITIKHAAAMFAKFIVTGEETIESITK